MIRVLFLLPLFFIVPAGYGQATDTSRNYIPETWKKYYAGPRVGVGLQRSFYAEAGIALQKYVYERRHGYMASTWYASVEWIPASYSQKTAFGYKVGAELINNGGAGGIEVKYLTDGDKNDVVITPKYGIGLGVVNIFYGYNISTSKYPFPHIRKSQFSLTINTSMLFYSMKKENK